MVANFVSLTKTTPHLRMESSMRVFLGLGSNAGNRQKNLLAALAGLEKRPGIRVRKISSVYQTSPVGPRQRWFLNAVADLETQLPPRKLLLALKRIERGMGRKKSVRWGPRVIDLDILFYGRKRVQTPGLTIPHPEFHRRKFVLKPLKEIAPNFRPPGFSQTVSRLLLKLTDSGQRVRLFKT